MLLSDLSRLDFRQLFICHKSLFYETYQSWSDSKKEFVVRFLEQEYAMDKDGAREALFGEEPSMNEAPPASSPMPVLQPPAMQRVEGVRTEIQTDRSPEGMRIEIDTDSRLIRKTAKPYISPWGPPPKSRGKKTRKRR